MLLRGLALPLATYRARRRAAVALVERHLFGAAPLLVVGCDEGRLRRERQDPWFDYYCGCHEPDAALLVLPDGSATLFLDPGRPERVVWDGPRLGPSARARAAHGVDRVAPREQLLDAVRAAARAVGGRIAMCHRTVEPGFQAEAFTRMQAELAPEVLVASVEDALRTQRMVKDADEVAWHRRAIARTADGLRAVLPRLKRLGNEAEVAAELGQHYRRHDWAPLAFPAIVGGGRGGATLHYPFNDQPLAPRAPILIDSGATAGGYCADVTRTVPRHGRFDDRRFRTVYELVLASNLLVRRHARPGVTLKQLNDIAWKPIIDAGFERHHGVSHHIGLDVHDPSDREAPLAPGMIISNEPGIYLPGEDFGIRIEDDLLITADGCEELTRAIPKTVAGVEAWMRG
jgi:Xaa-Pro aminopeptidase